MAERAQVYVTGRKPAKTSFVTRGLQLTKSRGGKDYLRAAVRALIYFAGNLQLDAERQALTKWLRANVGPAADRGILCIVATDQPQIAQPIVSNLGPLAERAVVRPHNAAVLAQTCREYDPGPAANMDLGVDGLEPLVPEEIYLLLKRAFSDFQSLKLQPLTGGRSAVDGVWRVEAGAADEELRSPFVVKCGPIDAITTQVSTYRDVVADRVPFRGCAPLCLERSLAGSTRRLSVSRFVEQAQRLDEILLEPGNADIHDLIVRIYQGPLRRWRAAPKSRMLQLLPEFIGWRSRPTFLRRLARTAARLQAAGHTVRVSPQQMFARMDALPAQLVPVCRAHGDLNLRNVFVSSRPGDVVLIDFTRAQVRPLSRDIARLDVGLAFDPELNTAQPIPGEVLTGFFTGNLFAISLPHMVRGDGARARLRAVQTLRHQMIVESSACGHDPGVEYMVAVAAELLYQAQGVDSWADLAFQCAESLVQTLP